MTDVILHQYAGSPFSEKIRSLLGYKEQSYQAVEIPVIMPKPDLMALTGGYRKDAGTSAWGRCFIAIQAIICRFLDRVFPDKPVYPQDQIASLTAAVHWTDTFLFKVSVAVAFQPRAMAANDLFSDPAVAEAFAKDRAELTKGSTELGMDLILATALVAAISALRRNCQAAFWAASRHHYWIFDTIAAGLFIKTMCCKVTWMRFLRWLSGCKEWQPSVTVSGGDFRRYGGRNRAQQSACGVPDASATSGAAVCCRR